jgi:preprotein translocase subunit SecA
MVEFITKALTKIFGTKSDKDLREIKPIVEKINAVYAQLRSISDDELRGKTEGLHQIIAERLSKIDADIAALHKKIADSPDIEIVQKDEIFNQIDKLEIERNLQLDTVLDDILPTAFAVVRETARRLKENKKLVVKATPHDEWIAARKSNVIIENGIATWSNRWLVAGHEMEWEMVHYDVQLIGGIVLHSGRIAEMATGEGKTLVATLPSFLRALSKRGVHIVTVNDYLAKRDCDWMAPLLEFHGLKVDCIDKHEPHSEGRIAAYKADVTYGTNNEFGFDYLRDNMARHVEEQVQRKHYFAMVDEVDSVLIDDARTPLIISGPVGTSDEQEFLALKPRISRLMEEQQKLVTGFLNEAKRLIKEGKEKEGGLALLRAHRGLPKFKPLIKFLSETGIKQILQKTENEYLQDNSRMMPEADKPLYFTIDEKNNTVDLTFLGIETITRAGEEADFFVIPDVGKKVAEIENNPSISDQEKVDLKEKVVNDYTAKSQRIHIVQQLLKGFALFEKDVDYVVMDNKVKIVDEQTGRILDGRRYSDGLHQALEAKEGVKVEAPTQTYATITLQNYFRMYHKLAGMTGTAETEEAEFYEIYKLDVVVIPTNVQAVRKDMEDKVYKTMKEKYNAVVQEIQELINQGRPVLVGTTSVESSELLSRFLQRAKIEHQVLNAKQHAKEAEIVSIAGKPRTVTIATNMAGRGTDIKLTPESKAAGGLAIIGTERHESRRVDRQLRGRAGRQGDPGSSQFFVSLEDHLMRLFGSDRIAKVMDRLGLQEGEVIQHSWITKSIERAQKKVEENNFGARKRLLEFDNVMNIQRSFIYKRRKNALDGERLPLDIMHIFYKTAGSLAENYRGQFNSFKLEVLRIFGIQTKITEYEFERSKSQEITDNLYRHAYQQYRIKNRELRDRLFPVIERVALEKGDKIHNVVVPITDGEKVLQLPVELKKIMDTKGGEVINQLEKAITLMIIDSGWKHHLRNMDDLRTQVHNAVHEQKDPLMVYKFEALKMFQSFIKEVNEDTLSFLTKATIPIYEEAPEEITQPIRQPEQPQPKLKEEKEGSEVSSQKNAPIEREKPKVQQVQKPITSQKVRDRNDKVTVKYFDGTLKEGVKYKTVEKDLQENRCILVE